MVKKKVFNVSSLNIFNKKALNKSSVSNVCNYFKMGSKMKKKDISEKQRIREIEEILKRIKGNIRYEGSGSQLITEIRRNGTTRF
ncbi:MAG: hypothetical protein ISS82_02625 [Nanoarchaeota archaeon]|nr:hypothetical protein [Nanoarchaeota archaeon]